MLNPAKLNRRRSAGFGLVEIMVAMVIGMFGVLIMMQVLSVSEEQKRTTTSGNDAMNEGVQALYTLQSELRMAGYGITDPLLLGCSLQLRAGVTLSGLAPVTINPALITGADANTDTLLLFYSNSYGTPQGDAVTGAVGNTVQTPSAFVKDDWVVVSPSARATPCSLTLDRVSEVNAGTGSVTLSSGTVHPVGSRLFNLGQTYRAVGYAVRNGNLSFCDYGNAAINCSTASAWTALANNIVSLRAQYGRDITDPNFAVPKKLNTGAEKTRTSAFPDPKNQVAGMDAIVDVYDQVAIDVVDTPDTKCHWARLSAVRLALTARSLQMEVADVTSTAPVWEGSAANNPEGSTAAAIDVSANTDWKKYRYKVFQSLAPIRNMSWMGKVTGC